MIHVAERSRQVGIRGFLLEQAGWRAGSALGNETWAVVLGSVYIVRAAWASKVTRAALGPLRRN